MYFSKEDAIHRLSMNDPELTHVQVYPWDQGDYAEALQHSTHIRKLQVVLEELGVYSDEEEEEEVDEVAQFEFFCRVVTSLKSLRTLSFFIEHEDDNDHQSARFHQQMRILLQHAQQIQTIVFHRAENCNPFLENLAEGIQDHTGLEVIAFPLLYGDGVFESLLRFMPTLSTKTNLKCLDFEFPDDIWDEGRAPTLDTSNAFLQSLFSLSPLEELQLDGFEFRNGNTGAMSQVANLRRLRCLRLLNCSMTMACLGSLCIAGSNIPELEELEMNGIRCGDYRRDDFTRFLGALSESPRLKRLFVRFYFEDDADFEWPSFDFLRTNTALKDLEISARCRARTAGAGFLSLCESLWTNLSLEKLTLRGLGDDHVDALVEMIRKNKGLERICLDDHSFSGTSLEKFVPALSKNKTLESLSLRAHAKERSVTSKEVADFVQLVLRKSRLKELFVDCNSEHMKMLLPGMAQNFCMERLYFSEMSREAIDLEKYLNAIGKLNKFGRCYLSERGPECRVAGVNLLAAVSDDLNCLFYHLRENPVLCDLELENAALETVSSPRISDDLPRPSEKKRRMCG